MNSFTYNQTFTITDAKYLASKISADLKRMQRFYNSPSDSSIELYESEITELLRYGYLKKVSYGFSKDGQFIEPTLIYTAQELASDFSTDDDPGRVKPGANTLGASFYSYLTYSDKWNNLSYAEREKFESNLRIKRTGADEPSINGYLSNDRSYSSGGQTLNRTSIKSY